MRKRKRRSHLSLSAAERKLPLLTTPAPIIFRHPETPSENRTVCKLLDFAGNAENAAINPYPLLNVGHVKTSGTMSDKMMRRVRILKSIVVVVQFLTTSNITAGHQQDMALAVDVVPHTFDILLLLAISAGV
jgi:hypothetical protein